MDRPYIEELRIENYGCIQNVTFRLSPLHALIGPNDSGKSTVLRALRTLAFLLAGGSSDESVALRRAIGAQSGAVIEFAASTSDATWLVRVTPAGAMGWTSFERMETPLPREIPFRELFGPLTGSRPAPSIAQALAGVQTLRLDPDALRAPHELIQDGQPLRFVDEHGTGLPALYDALVSRDIQSFLDINEEIGRLFPDVKSISLTNPSPTTKAIGVKLVNGTVIPAELMSEGLLYYLAFAALRHLEPTALLLVEEPENGLHPARIIEVMRVLRAISQRMQVVIATHSPLVVNELQPEEVTVVTRSRERGTSAVLIKDTPGFDERAKVYALGELWLSYANGDDEGPLIRGGPRP